MAQNERKMVQPSETLPVIGDAITFLGHASFLASLKRREFFKPDIGVAYQSVCSKSNPVTTFLFRDELPKHIKYIGEVNKTAKTTVVRSSLVRRTSDYKSSSNNFKLFISFIRPHKPVTTSTVGRWIKSVLSSAGIDTSVF